MYLKASGDNTPATVLDSFVDAVNEYGLPNKVRSDHGMCWFSSNFVSFGIMACYCYASMASALSYQNKPQMMKR